MTSKQFYTVFSAALADADRDAFVSDWALSSMWDDAEDAEIPPERIAQLGYIWDIAKMSIKDLRQTTGLSQAAFAEYFCVPRRTVENWEARGGCPDYVRLLIADSLGLLRVSRED